MSFITLVLWVQIVLASILGPAWTPCVQFRPNFHHTIHWLDDQMTKNKCDYKDQCQAGWLLLWKTIFLSYLVFSCLYWSKLSCVVDAPREVFWRQNAATARCAFLRGRAPAANEFSGKSGLAPIPGSLLFTRGLEIPWAYNAQTTPFVPFLMLYNGVVQCLWNVNFVFPILYSKHSLD